MDLAGLPVPGQCQGASVRPFLEGQIASSAWRQAVHWEFDFRVFARTVGLPLADCNLAVHRDQAGKLVHFAGMPDLYFDLESDPDEQHPLIGHPAMVGYQSGLAEWRPPFDDGPLVNLLATPKGMITLRDPQLVG